MVFTVASNFCTYESRFEIFTTNIADPSEALAYKLLNTYTGTAENFALWLEKLQVRWAKISFLVEVRFMMQQFISLRCWRSSNQNSKE